MSASRWGPRILEDGTYVDRPRPSRRYLAATAGTGLAVIAAVALAIAAPDGGARWGVVALALGLLFALLAPLTWALFHVEYRLEAGALRLRVGLQRRTVPYGRILEVRQLPGAMATLGNRPSGVVELDASTRFPIRLTPSEPDEFIEELRRKIETVG